MNGYICLWKGKRCEVEAETSYAAQQKAVETFRRTSRKKVKGYDVSVTLAEKNGEQVTHAPTF